jgi:hypothetical protein
MFLILRRALAPILRASRIASAIARTFPFRYPSPESTGSSKMANAAMEGFVRWCEGKLVKSRDQLEPLESGRMHIGTRPFGGQWEDITLREIRRVRANIAELEALIVQYSS